MNTRMKLGQKLILLLCGITLCFSLAYERSTSAKVRVTVTAADTTPPTFSAFDVNPKNIAPGGTVTITYSISDSGSGLRQADLWRAPDNGGAPGTWAKIKTNLHSGSGLSSFFTDSISAAGTYWYGMHIFDNAGDRKSTRLNSREKITSYDASPLTISVVDVNPQNFSPNVTVTTPFSTLSLHDALPISDLWRAPDNGGAPGTWAKIKTNLHSGSGLSSFFTDSISAAGTYWYGMHIFDNA